MKLLSKINHAYFKYGLLIFLMADAIIIFLSNYILKSEIDQQLKLEAKEITEIMQIQNEFTNIYPTAVVEILNKKKENEVSIKDTMIYDALQDEMAPFRESVSIKHINGKTYRITTRHMLMEFNDIFTLFTSLISIILFFIFLGLLFFTKRLNNSLWHTFNSNVKRLQSYKLDPPTKLDLEATGIDEFDSLNQVLSQMTSQLEQDFLASKEFSANAAHEIQTPLAIIQNRCEYLFSNPQLPKETIVSIRDIYLAANHLSGITKALLLLGKIEQGQFHENQIVSFKQIIETWLSTYEDIVSDRKINVRITGNETCQTNMDPRLSNLLVQNLLINAIKNCPEGKDLEIQLDSTVFHIMNYGEKKVEYPEFLFNRFYKESQLNGSNGIGLAIVKKIVDHYKLAIRYNFKTNKHIFSVDLAPC